MKQRLRPLMEADGCGARRIYSFDHIMERLKSIRKETVDFCGAQSSVITTPSDEQRAILRLLGVKLQ